MLPHITLTGNLTRDPELAYTPGGKARLRFSVACSAHRRQLDGTWANTGTTYVNITAWGDTAEQCAEQLSKGMKVHVSGRLRQHSWDDAKTGEKRTSYEVDPDTISIVVERRRPGSHDEPDPWVQPNTPTTVDDPNPF